MRIFIAGATGVIGRRVAPGVRQESGWAPKYPNVREGYRAVVAQMERARG